ncbi:MAG: alanine dehydrogenase [Anaerolineae bacterium]
MGMIVGIPKEQHPYEYRVGMTPAGVSVLTGMGHQCYVESGAGLGSGFSDAEYEQAGARITYQHAETFRRADLLLKVQRPTPEEIPLMPEGQIVMAFIMMAGLHDRGVHAMQERGLSVVAYEMIRENDGHSPVLYPLSQIGGQMAAQIAAQFLQNNHGGKGILLGGTVGVPPADVVILGAGVVGLNAAEAFVGRGARVLLMDRNLRALQRAQERFGSRITTMMSHDFNLKRVCKFADVLLGAVYVPGERAPILITREMVRSMRPGSLIIDMSIDQGGCVETSRPTTHADPTFVAEGVLHYCVHNVPGVVGRTSTHAYMNAAWPFVVNVAEMGLEAAVEANSALRRGLLIHRGELLFGQAD